MGRRRIWHEDKYGIKDSVTCMQKKADALQEEELLYDYIYLRCNAEIGVEEGAS